MDTAVVALLDETRVVLECMLVTVLEDEIAVIVKDILLQDLVRKSLQPLQGIRRVGEDQVELLTADREEIEDVVTDHSDIAKPQTLGLGLYERCVLADHLHTVNPGCPPGSELVCDSSSAPEKVQDLQVLELIFVVKDIEKALLGEVRGWTRLIAHRGDDVLAFESAADYSHILSTEAK